MFVMSEEEKAKLREINGKDFRACEIARYYGKKVIDCVHCEMMKYGIFVIPGETRWECQKCGECCTGMEGRLKLNIAGLTFDKDGICDNFNRLTKQCNRHATKLWQCRIWPFYGTFDSDTHPEVLVTISSLCHGLGKGEIITDEVYNKLVEFLKHPDVSSGLPWP